MKELIQGSIFLIKRQEGLTWMIKAINKLGSKVILSSLPNFLDEASIKYLFTVKLNIFISI
jgi:hypothetical protein